MEQTQYYRYWKLAEPLMRKTLEEVKVQLVGKTSFEIREIKLKSDDDFGLSLEFWNSDNMVLVLDFLLLDCEDFGLPGCVALTFNAVLADGSVCGRYAANNFTDKAFIPTVEELAARVEELTADLIVDFVLSALIGLGEPA